MTTLEIQQSPYNLTLIDLNLSINNTKSACFRGEIEILKTLNNPVIGIFFEHPLNEIFNISNVKYLKTFYYDNAKYQFKQEDCVKANHFLVINNFVCSEIDYTNFLGQLFHSKINKIIETPCLNPFP